MQHCRKFGLKFIVRWFVNSDSQKAKQKLKLGLLLRNPPSSKFSPNLAKFKSYSTFHCSSWKDPHFFLAGQKIPARAAIICVCFFISKQIFVVFGQFFSCDYLATKCRRQQLWSSLFHLIKVNLHVWFCGIILRRVFYTVFILFWLKKSFNCSLQIPVHSKTFA